MCENSGKKKVLILGAGLVSAPLVEYLYRDKNIEINICSSIENELNRLTSRYPDVKSTCVDVLNDSHLLTQLCKQNDIVVSLLPNNLQHLATEQCVKNKRNLVTASYASYASTDTHQLHKLALKEDIILLNEIGLDPGIDHMLAMELIDNLKKKHGKIESLTSFCGGLPAPEHANNALRYKFSWSPRGALLNTLASAKYVWNGELVEIPGGGDVISSPMELDFLPELGLEGFPNRDSTEYAQLYQIHDTVHSLLRGTLRYKGFSRCMQAIQQIGLMDTKPHPLLQLNREDITWKQLISTMLGLYNLTNEKLHEAIVKKLGSQTLLDCIQDLGLLTDVSVLKMITPLDTLCNHLSKLLTFSDNERDLIIMRLECVVRWPNDDLEKHIVEFVVYGDTEASGGHSAMAKTVGYPVAIATQMILNNEINQKGVILPLSSNIYRPILLKLSDEGFTTTKTVIKLS